MHYLEGRSGSFSSFNLYFEGRRLKKEVNFFEEKSAPREKILATPMNLSTPGKVLWVPMGISQVCV